MIRLIFISACGLHVILQTLQLSSGERVSFQMRNQRPRWGTNRLLICPEDHYIFISGTPVGSRTRTRRFKALTNDEIMMQHTRCNCKNSCSPQTTEKREYWWTLRISYSCSETCFICEGDNATISCLRRTTLDIESANYGRTSTNVCRNPSVPSENTNCTAADVALKEVKKACQDKVSCKLNANDDTFGKTCQETYKYLTVQFKCTFYTTEKANQTSSAGQPTSSISTQSSLRTVDGNTHTISISTSTGQPTSSISTQSSLRTVAGNTHTTSISTSDPIISSQIANNSNSALFSDQNEKSTVIAVAVTIPIVVAAGSTVAVILVFRRFHSKKNKDVMYKNTPTGAGQSPDVGFINRTCSKETDDFEMHDAHMQVSDTCSNSGDSGYTDMHNEDNIDVGNNDYYDIKENIVSDPADSFDDQYYAIKENAGTEYNKIVFKPKDIPDDPNYGHIFKPGVADTTYDHTEVSETPPNLMAQGDVNDYSHLNQTGQTSSYTNWNGANDSKTGKSNDGVDEVNGHDYFILEQGEPPDVCTDGSCHEYVILEKDDTQMTDIRCTAVGTEDESHSYFVLNKEENVIGKNDEIKSTNDDDETFRKYNEAKSTNDSNDQTYFEDPTKSQMDRESHQYQAMEQLVPDNEIKWP